MDIKESKIEDSIIKDSGSRTEFSSGACRDIQKGKGRCDLMPLDVVAYVAEDEIFAYIESYKISGDTKHLVLAIREFIHNCELYKDIPSAILDVAKHFEQGAEKYGENNWQKGIPTKSYIDSTVRHYLKYWAGWDDEPHHRAFIWNLMCCIWTDQNKPECRSYPMK